MSWRGRGLGVRINKFSLTKMAKSGGLVNEMLMVNCENGFT